MSQFNNTIPKNRRLAIRKLPKGKVKVTCRKGTLDLGPNLAVGLVDVSETGMRIHVKEALAEKQEVTVTLEGQNHLRPIRFLGHIIWMVPSEQEGIYRVGIHLDKRLPYIDYAKLT